MDLPPAASPILNRRGDPVPPTLGRELEGVAGAGTEGGGGDADSAREEPGTRQPYVPL